MSNSIEIRPAKNGVILVLRDEDGEDVEYVYDSPRKMLKVLKELLDKDTLTTKL